MYNNKWNTTIDLKTVQVESRITLSAYSSAATYHEGFQDYTPAHTRTSKKCADRHNEQCRLMVNLTCRDNVWRQKRALNYEMNATWSSINQTLYWDVLRGIVSTSALSNWCLFFPLLAKQSLPCLSWRYAIALYRSN